MMCFFFFKAQLFHTRFFFCEDSWLVVFEPTKIGYMLDTYDTQMYVIPGSSKCVKFVPFHLKTTKKQTFYISRRSRYDTVGQNIV